MTSPVGSQKRRRFNDAGDEELCRVTTSQTTPQAPVSDRDRVFLENQRRMTLELLHDSSLTDKHRELRSKVEKSNKNSGRWLLESEEYIYWLAPRHSASFLWLYGASGCGKSMLCSTVVDSLLRSAVENSKMIVAYWYFDNADARTQEFHNMVCLVLRRIATSATPWPKPLRDLAEKYCCIRTHNTPGTMELVQALKDTVTILDEDFFLVLDAIDEYYTGNEVFRRKFLDFLVELGNTKQSRLHILVTSLPEPDIQDAFRRLSSPPVTMDVEKAVSLDVAACLDMTIIRYAMEKRWSFDTKTRIEKALKNVGRFRIVSLQLETLRRCDDPEEIDTALKSIPLSIEDVYLRELLGVPPDRVRTLKHIFSWISVATRRLTTLELVAAPGVDIFNPDDLLRVCPSSMIRVERRRIPAQNQGDLPQQTIPSPSGTDMDVVTFDHSSVKRFLYAPELQRFHDDRVSQFFVSEKAVNAEFAKLLLDQVLAVNQPIIWPSFISERPFLPYAARYWYEHIMNSGITPEEDKSLYPKLLVLFGDPMSPAYLNWVRIWNPETKVQDLRTSEYSCASPLYMSIFLRLQGISDSLIGKRLYINVKGGRVRTTLRLAAQRGEIRLSQKLIAAGERVDNASDFEPTALYMAVQAGNGELLQVLLMAGANPDKRPHGEDSALQLVIARGLTDIAALLAASGADVNLEGGIGTPLQAAAAAGNTEVMEILLDRGAKPTAVGGLLGTAIQAAETGRHPDAIKLLASQGVAWDEKGDSVWREAYDLWASQTSMKTVAESLLASDPTAQSRTQVVLTEAQKRLAGVLRVLGSPLPTASDVRDAHRVPLGRPAITPEEMERKLLYLRLLTDKGETEHTEKLNLAQAFQTAGKIGMEGKYYFYKALFWAIMLHSKAQDLHRESKVIAAGDDQHLESLVAADHQLHLELGKKMDDFGVTMLQFVSSQKEIEYGISNHLLPARKELVKCYALAFEVASRYINQRQMRGRASYGHVLSTIGGDGLKEFRAQHERFESVMKEARLEEPFFSNLAKKAEHDALQKVRQEMREGFQALDEDTQERLTSLEHRVVGSIRDMLPGIIREEMHKVLAGQNEDKDA